MLTFKSVNKELKETFGDGIEILQGDGYIYFWGTLIDRCYSTTVPVPRLNRLDLNHWIDEATHLVNESKQFLDDQMKWEKRIMQLPRNKGASK